MPTKKPYPAQVSAQAKASKAYHEGLAKKLAQGGTSEPPIVHPMRGDVVQAEKSAKFHAEQAATLAKPTAKDEDDGEE